LRGLLLTMIYPTSTTVNFQICRGFKRAGRLMFSPQTRLSSNVIVRDRLGLGVLFSCHSVFNTESSFVGWACLPSSVGADLCVCPNTLDVPRFVGAGLVPALILFLFWPRSRGSTVCSLNPQSEFRNFTRRSYFYVGGLKSDSPPSAGQILDCLNVYVGHMQIFINFMLHSFLSQFCAKIHCNKIFLMCCPNYFL